MRPGPRKFGLALAGLAVAVAVIAFFSIGALDSEQAAGSSNPAPKGNILAAAISVTPTNAVPNQTVAIVGSGFTVAATAGGAGPNGVHQITGSGVSFIKIADITLGPPHVIYPIDLDTGGNFVATAVVPVTAATLSAGSITVVATDDKLVTATTTFTVPQRTLTLDPDSGRRGSTVTATGGAFPASNPGITGSFSVNIDYAGTQLASVVPDSSGDFELTFTVPVDAAIPSDNIVTASLVGQQSATSTDTHSVPAASMSVAPDESPPGSSVTVSGSNFPAFAPVSSLKVGTAQVLPSLGPTTDVDGAFSSDILVPGLLTGTHVVVATVGGVAAVTTFKITEPLIAPTPTPTPTPTPAPVVEPVAGLALLLDADNLVRVWNFNNSTKAWTFFDPRPSFAAANTITGMTSGQVYWINVLTDQTVNLNGQQRVLAGGWNLLSW